MTDPWSVLTAKQASVARPFLADREHDRRHLVIYLSGAHAYGFPSPDSDLDLKCIHITPTRDLLGLDPVTEPADQISVIDGVELDYGSNELAGVLRGILKGNGNYLERVLGDLVLGGDRSLLAEARAVVTPVLSRRVARHYGGFAMSQLKLFDTKPTAKRALYVLRTAGTGRCFLARGTLHTDIAQLADFMPPDIFELVTVKRQSERQELSPTHAATWRTRLLTAIESIDAAVATSVLPDEPPADAVSTLDSWLRDVRKRNWD